MSSVSFGGLMSGLDTQSIVTQLLALRRQPITRLETRISGLETTKAALSDLQSKMTSLMESAQGLDTAQEFASLTTTSSDEDSLSATAGALANIGTYDVTVNRLATARKDMSQGYDSALDSVGTGSFTITVDGVDTIVDFSAGAGSLSDLKTAINDADAGVSASILYDGSETGGYHLVVTSSETGTDAAATLDFSGLSGGTDVVLGNVTAAQNAEVVIDTLTVSSQTNSITSAIEGVTLELKAADIANPMTLEIGIDADDIKSKVEDFVDAYNDLYGYIDQQRQDGATLRGDSLIRSVTDRIGRIMTTRMSSGEITMLYQIGVKQDEDGLLRFEEEEFTEALAENYAGVKDLFTSDGANVGPVSLLGDALDEMTDSIDGLFKIRNDGIEDRIDTYNDTILRYESSLESYETTLNAKFAAMEQLLSTLQSQGSALGSMGIYT